ncbi:MAG: adenosylcobinamide-GDP ribazoletransferase [Firmicutes bacterium]|nr:adenosylcobinamide-GDP ribazoletransferase [Bacillota bacterium]
MTLLRSIAMSFAMFSRIPMPRQDWNKANMRYLLAALPLVGVVCGALLWGWAVLCRLADLGPLLRGAGFVLLPLLLTGGVHLDGLADTADALASHAEPEKKRAILKDPHTGAFAIIAVAAYLIWMTAAYAELSIGKDILLIALIPVCSRALAAILSLALPAGGSEGLLATFRGAADKTAALVILALFLAAAVAVMLLYSPLKGGVLAAAIALAAGYAGATAKKQFGGMSGDIAGFSIEMTELIMLTALLICQKAVS